MKKILENSPFIFLFLFSKMPFLNRTPPQEPVIPNRIVVGIILDWDLGNEMNFETGKWLFFFNKS